MKSTNLKFLPDEFEWNSWKPFHGQLAQRRYASSITSVLGKKVSRQMFCNVKSSVGYKYFQVDIQNLFIGFLATRVQANFWDHNLL